jgi:hypothetical protein
MFAESTAGIDRFMEDIVRLLPARTGNRDFGPDMSPPSAATREEYVYKALRQRPATKHRNPTPGVLAVQELPGNLALGEAFLSLTNTSHELSYCPKPSWILYNNQPIHEFFLSLVYAVYPRILVNGRTS